MRKHLLILFIALFTTYVASAQVTTSSITGTVKDTKGVTLPGATVIATHVPSGSVYSTVTSATGKYTIPNMRVGGPYTVKITYVGFEPRTVTDLNLGLGDPLKIDIKLDDAAHALSAVNVKSNKGAVISSERTGASTRVNQRQLVDLPTVSRSLQDFTRLTPQAISSTSGADGSPLGIQFAGQSNKFNQFTIDGANATDVFGLAGSGTNGGQAGINPVPLESIQEVQIVLSPYDVTQSGFTGGGINAVSKSGTNDFHGSTYYTFQNEKLVGKNVLSSIPYAKFKNYTFGASLGGAIIKNKLFFYANYEKYDNISPIGFDPTEAGSGSNFSVATLQDLKDFMQTKYGYDVGSYGAMNKETFSNSVFARIDWNINDKNKITFRHSYVDGSAYNISRGPNTIAFSEAGNYQINTTNSSVIELNSSISKSSSNVLRLTYNYVRDRRATSDFPNIQITQAGLTYNLGADFSSAANSLGQDNYTIADNFTLYKGNHTITLGTSNEFYNTANVFQQGYGGAYTYARSTVGVDNIADFKANNIAPSSYTLTYVPGDVTAKYTAAVHAAQLSIYGQDVWAINDNFKLTYGLRVDMPLYFNKPTENAAFNADPVFSSNPNTTVPKSTPLFSPRAGFNYNVNGTGETQLRGGIGLFTGRAPFVWLSNAYTNTSVATIRFTAIPASGRFPVDQAALSNTLHGVYIPPTGSFASGEIDVIDKNFKVPQTFRANLAVDQKLPVWGLIGTLEGIFTKNINAVYYQNLNVGPQTGEIAIGNSTREFHNFARLNSNFSDVIQVTNTSLGYAYNLTAQIQKPFEKGWTGSIAYTFGESFSLNDGTSSTAASNWRFVETGTGLNNPAEARANYDPGSRFVAYVSKKFSYLKGKMATTVGLIYTGQSGIPFSYGYSKNITGDDVTNKGTANNSGNLIYVPSESELNDPNGYVAYGMTVTLPANGAIPAKTPSQQWQEFGDFIHSQSGLTEYEGKVIPRNAERTPWENHFDLKVTQDFTLVNNHKLSLSLDMLNVGNFFNQAWGHGYFITNQTYVAVTVGTQSATTTTAGVTTTSKTTFQFDKSKLNIIDGAYRPYFVNDFTSRWRGQLSVKYSF